MWDESEKLQWLWDSGLISCHIGHRLVSTAQQILAVLHVSLVKVFLHWSESQHIWPHWQALMYVRAICRLVCQPTGREFSQITWVQWEAKMIVIFFLSTSWKTGPTPGNDSSQSWVFSTREKKKVAVSFVFFMRGWQDSTDGTGPCWTKRIMETKHLWQV